MDWVLNNLENVVIPLIIAILYFVGNAAKKKGEGDVPDALPSGQEIDPEEARRVSEIQEEIRRKIAERTGRAPPPLPSVPGQQRQQSGRPYMAPKGEAQPARPVRRQTSPPIPQPAYSADTHKRELKAKMKKVRELEAQIKSKPSQKPWSDSCNPTVSAGALQRELFKDLSNPLGQKKAILVSEILGSPVGIRGPSGWKSKV